MFTKIQKFFFFVSDTLLNVIPIIDPSFNQLKKGHQRLTD
ncbi:hypothetical protein STRDD04_00952 [Streptococcus sp. DD04]|nr:hypothetical protein STRDD04_00952 [Streptococcus sp. DD04]